MRLFCTFKHPLRLRGMYIQHILNVLEDGYVCLLLMQPRVHSTPTVCPLSSVLSLKKLLLATALPIEPLVLTLSPMALNKKTKWELFWYPRNYNTKITISREKNPVFFHFRWFYFITEPKLMERLISEDGQRGVCQRVYSYYAPIFLCLPDIFLSGHT